MTAKESYERYADAYKAFSKGRMSHFFIEQEKRYVKPFKMFGNLYYVGDNWVCAHLYDTGEGLILFDAGNYGTCGMLINAIWEVGFNPADIKWVILSHGHLDHIGCARFLKNMFGCRILMGAPDADMLTNRPELSFIQDNPNIAEQLFEVDTAINDGDEIAFGGTAIRFRLVPGHTMGCIACFFDVGEGSTVARAGYYGGFGLNTLQADYLKEIGDFDYETREIYLQSLAKVRNEHVDLFMGNHTNNNNLLEKRARMLENPDHNPFLDKNAWGAYLDRKRDEVLALIEHTKRQNEAIKLENSNM